MEQNSLCNQASCELPKDDLPTEKKRRKANDVLLIVVISLMIFCVVALGFITIHFWEDGSCVEPQTCKLCKKEYAPAPGHKWKDADCVSPAKCTVCGTQKGSAAGHIWQMADCTAPKICMVCGLSEGAALGHNWQEASCSSPKTCMVCGLTEGTTNQHIMENRNCETPAFCVICGYSDGVILNHNWLPATVNSPKTCDRCGVTEGRALPPLTGQYEVDQEIADIRGIYNEIQGAMDCNTLRVEKIQEGVRAYYEHTGQLAAVVFLKGADGIGAESDNYSRFYYFKDGKLIFAAYEGQEVHRLYFFNNALIRWNYRTTGINESYDCWFDVLPDRFAELEALARNEAAPYLD